MRTFLHIFFHAPPPTLILLKLVVWRVFSSLILMWGRCFFLTIFKVRSMLFPHYFQSEDDAFPTLFLMWGSVFSSLFLKWGVTTKYSGGTCLDRHTFYYYCVSPETLIKMYVLWGVHITQTSALIWKKIPIWENFKSPPPPKDRRQGLRICSKRRSVGGLCCRVWG